MSDDKELKEKETAVDSGETQDSRKDDEYEKVCSAGRKAKPDR